MITGDDKVVHYHFINRDRTRSFCNSAILQKKETAIENVLSNSKSSFDL